MPGKGKRAVDGVFKSWAKRFWKWLSGLGTLDVILAVTFGFFLWFNGRMLHIYETQGSMPESYAVAVIGATIGECGICGWIRTTKDKAKKLKDKSSHDTAPQDEDGAAG